MNKKYVTSLELAKQLKNCVSEKLLKLYTEAAAWAQQRKETVGENNEYYITLEELDRLITEIESEGSTQRVGDKEFDEIVKDIRRKLNGEGIHTLDDALREFREKFCLPGSECTWKDVNGLFVQEIEDFLHSVWDAAEAAGKWEIPEKREKPKDRTGYHNSYAEGYDDGWNECVDSLAPQQKEDHE